VRSSKIVFNAEKRRPKEGWRVRLGYEKAWNGNKEGSGQKKVNFEKIFRLFSTGGLPQINYS
jgi:hypothetical protein